MTQWFDEPLNRMERNEYKVINVFLQWNDRFFFTLHTKEYRLQSVHKVCIRILFWVHLIRMYVSRNWISLKDKEIGPKKITFGDACCIPSGRLSRSTWCLHVDTASSQSKFRTNRHTQFGLKVKHIFHHFDWYDIHTLLMSLFQSFHYSLSIFTFEMSCHDAVQHIECNTFVWWWLKIYNEG